MKPVTVETLLADQRDRIERKYAKKGTNAVLDFINELNGNDPNRKVLN